MNYILILLLFCSNAYSISIEGIHGDGVFYFLIFLVILLLFTVFFYKRENALLHKVVEDMKNDSEAHDRFISYISHELRSPMTAIMGLSNLVLETKLSNNQRDSIQKIEKSSHYILTLLNDILDLSKIEAGELKIEKIEFNINDILNYVFNIISVQAKKNNVDIYVDIANDVPSHLVGDSLRIGQILINLLSNAVKFSKDGKVTLEVKVIKNIDNIIVLEFIVSDTGIGMNHDELEKLFNPYYQADSSISRKFGGTGLGLSISKNLVELMNGTISVDSEKNIGTKFKFTIEFGLKDSKNKRQYRLPSDKLLNKNILIVDSCNKRDIPLMHAFNYFQYKVDNIRKFKHFKDKKYDIVVINPHYLHNNTILDIKRKYNSKILVFDDIHVDISDDILTTTLVDGYIKAPITIQNILNLISEIYSDEINKVKKITKKDELKKILSKYNDKKFLIADDSEVNHKVIEGMFSKTGIKLFFAVNGKEVLDILDSNDDIDLIFMDINMPIMNGYETTKVIRKKGINIPIIALSADISKEAIKKSLEIGMQGHLAKPMNLEHLTDIIVDVFEKSSTS